MKNRRKQFQMGSQSVTRRVISYIEKNLEEDLALEKVAEELNYSKFYIARTFKENTGIALHKYIKGRRLAQAAEKLALGGKPVSEIALEAGYGSQQAFTWAFRREYGCAPCEYRRIGQFVPKQRRIEMGTVLPVHKLAGGRMAA